MITGLDFGEDVFEPISCHAMMVFIKALEDVLKNEDLSKKCGAFYQLQQVQKRLAAIADHMNIIGQYPQRRFLNVLWSVRRIFNLYLSSLDHSDDELSMEQSLVRSHTLQIRRRFDGFDMFSYLYHCLKEVWQLHSTLDWSQEDEENRRRDSECCLRFLSDEHNNDPLNDAYCPVITVLETPEDQATLSSRAVLLSEIYSRCTPNLWNADALHEELTSHRCSVEEENLEPYDDEWSVFNPSCTSHGLIPHFVLGVNWEGEKVVLLEAHTTIDTARRSNGLAESPRSDDSNIGRDECIDSEFQALFFCDSKHRYTWCHPALMLVHGIVQARRFPHLTSLNASELSRYIVAGEACNAAQNLACSIPETVFTNNLEPCACLVMEYPTQNQNVLTLEDYLFHKGGIPELTLPRVLRWIRQVCDTSLYLELSPDTLPDEVRAQYCSLCPSHIFLSEKKSFPVPQLRVVPPIYYHMNTRWRPPDSAICPAAYNLALIFMCMWTRRKPWHTYSSHQPLKVIQSLRSGEILPYDIPKDLPLELRVALLRCFMTKKTVTKDDSNVVNASQHALKNRRNRNLSLVAAVAGSTPFSPQLRDELSSLKRGSIRKGGVTQSRTCGNGQNISEYSSILDQVSEEVHSSSKDYRLRSPMTVREFVHILQDFWQENYSNAEDFSENAAKYMNDRMIQSASEYEGMRLSGEDKETELNDWVPRRIPDFFCIQYLDE